jgi:hypothetical protein
MSSMSESRAGLCPHRPTPNATTTANTATGPSESLARAEHRDRRDNERPQQDRPVFVAVGSTPPAKRASGAAIRSLESAKSDIDSDRNATSPTERV